MNKTKNIIEIRLLGSFCIKSNKGRVITPNTQKACAVVAMLALSPDGTKTRAWLKDKLWSEYSERRAAANLRQALTEIRKSFGKNNSHLITTDNTYVKLNLDYIDIDIDYVKSNHKTVHLSEQLINTDLLEGMDVNDAEFEEWLRIERSSWDLIGGVSPKPRKFRQPQFKPEMIVSYPIVRYMANLNSQVTIG